MTIDSRRRELQAFARMAVKQGYPAESLATLAELLNPDLVEEVLEAYWEENGEEPHVYTIELAWKLLSVARATGCLPERISKSSTRSARLWKSTGRVG